MIAGLANEARFLAATLLSIPDYVYAFDRQHRFVYANTAMLNLFGMTEDELLGKDFADLHYPQDLARKLDADIELIYTTGQTIEDQVFYTTPAGISAYFEYNWGPVFSEDGAVELVVGVSRDQTQRQGLEKKLRDEEERKSFLLQVSDVLNPLSDPDLVKATACRMICEKLDAARAFYAEGLDEADNEGSLRCGQFVRRGSPIIRPELYAKLSNALAQQGEAASAVVSITDVARDERLDEQTREALLSLGIRALLSVGVAKAENRTAAFHLHHDAPRQWDDADIESLKGVADRTWTAARRAYAEESVLRKNRILEAINRIFQEALRAGSEEELGRLCLAVAEDATGAAFSFMGEINSQTHLFDEISVSDRGWTHFAIKDPAFPYGTPPTGLLLHGLYGHVLVNNRSLIVNEPQTHPERVGVPEGHPDLRSFMGVPLERNGKAVGMIGFGRNEGSFNRSDLEAAEALAPAIMQAFAGKRMAEALRESEIRSRKLVEGIAQAFWEADTDGMPTTDSPSWRAYTGQSIDQWMGGSWIEAVHPEDRDWAKRVWADAVTERDLVDAEYRLRSPDGSYRWTNVRATPLVDDNGAIKKWVGMNIDIHNRKKVEIALRESEARFRQFSNFTRDVIWIRDGRTLHIEFINNAFERLYGVARERVLPPAGVDSWVALIVAEDRPKIVSTLEAVKGGEAVTHDYRIIRADGGIRWIRSTDFPLFDDQGNVERIGGIASDITDMKQATEHQAVLLAELQHRTRNIMAMVRSLASRTGETAKDVPEYTELIGGRLKALSRTQALLTRAANAGVSLKTLLREELEVAGPQGQYILLGADVELSPKAAEVLTLGIHELTTNALKYGALRQGNGRLQVEWTTFLRSNRPWLRIEWTESGLLEPLAPPLREGMGTDLIRGRVPYELRGRGSIDFRPQGVSVIIEFPMRAGSSILETDGLRLGTINKQAGLMMNDKTPLLSLRVLVVEDEFYTASDTAHVLKDAGAIVVGPASREDVALSLIDNDHPDAAIVDLNLGRGIDLTVASRLQARQIPFVILTGYDDAVIPREYDAVPRIQKPVELTELVRAVAVLCRPDGASA